VESVCSHRRLCARDPQRNGLLNGIVALTEGVGKMLGPALCAPALAWGLSARPAAEASPSGALLVFAAAAAFIGLIAAAALAALPRSLSNAAPSEVLSTPPPSEGEGGGVIRGAPSRL